MTKLKAAFQNPANQWTASSLPNPNRRDARSRLKDMIRRPRPPSPLARPAVQNPVNRTPGQVRLDMPPVMLLPQPTRAQVDPGLKSIPDSMRPVPGLDTLRESIGRKHILSEFKEKFPLLNPLKDTLKMARAADGTYKFKLSADHLSFPMANSVAQSADDPAWEYFSGTYDPKTHTVEFDEPGKLKLSDGEPKADLNDLIKDFFGLLERFQERVRALSATLR